MPACTPGGAPAGSGAAALRRQAVLFDFHDQEVPYEKAWAWQRACLAAAAGEGGPLSAALGGAGGADCVLLLQHPPTYTLGAGSTTDNVLFDLDDPPHPIYRTERGGEVTYHGPGQLVLYPILNLGRHKQDLHWYLRSLEEVVLRALASVSGLQGERVEGLTGVWVGGAKLAAIGVRARKWVTYHGLALNVATDLAPFGLIVPCGIEGRPVGSVESALGLRPHMTARAGDSAAAAAADAAVATGGGGWGAEQRELMVEYRYGLLEALEEVFGLELVGARPEQLDALAAAAVAAAAGPAAPETAAAAV
ncbi:MAG: hypothetical protein J3K34DRAFT_523463 [Monoraphidium minutum]|nr:MAG: hypothetical protein J3K34DRAFT_523463 [Monoraphidium minutum]